MTIMYPYSIFHVSNARLYNVYVVSNERRKRLDLQSTETILELHRRLNHIRKIQ